MLLAVPDFLSVERSGVAQRIAEHLGEKIALHLRFVEFRQAAGGLQIGPFHEHGVGGFQLVLVEPLVFGRVLQKTRQDEAVRLGLAEGDRRIDGKESLLGHLRSRHYSQTSRLIEDLQVIPNLFREGVLSDPIQARK